jgi:hypothetical protein
MNLQNKLDQFRADNPYDVDTQAKRLLASNDKPLILHVLALGLAVAKQRQRHVERSHIKNIGEARQKERFVPGPVTGSIVVKPSKATQNAMRSLILDVWRINGEMKLGDATSNDLQVAIKRERASQNGHAKNAELYFTLDKPINGTTDQVRQKWTEKTVRGAIKNVYGEFRTTEAT